MQGFGRASETLAIIWSPFNWVLLKKARRWFVPRFGETWGRWKRPAPRNDSVTHGPGRVSGSNVLEVVADPIREARTSRQSVAQERAFDCVVRVGHGELHKG